MEEQAMLTGDVFDSGFVPEEEPDLHFLFEDSVHRFTISLKQIMECVKFAEEQHEIPPLPEEYWGSIIGKYADADDFYRGKEYEQV